MDRDDTDAEAAARRSVVPLISLHGGHSSDFCRHAHDPLDRIVAAYQRSGFSIVGITEHIPPLNNAMRYPDEAAAGMDAADMLDRFERYFETARRLKREYSGEMKILVGFETEWYPGAREFIQDLIAKHSPDYLIGSVHHIGETCFDFDEDSYTRATALSGGLDQLYEKYFDLQLEMINCLCPAVVGHFDLIRRFDRDYQTRMNKPHIQRRIERNLELVADKELLLDLNTRAYMNGFDEPYPCRAIIEQARRMEISMVPGDDSHDVAGVGFGIEQAIHMLGNAGFDTDWNSIVEQLAVSLLRQSD